jgi:micrococcal nuclease
MPSAVWLERALITSALLLLWSPVFACSPDHIDETVTVTWVYDGDTLRLEDGRKLRLIGINAPEVGHHQKQDEPFAQAATQALIQLIDASKRQIGVQYDQERLDRHGRLLAHIYTNEDLSINAQMIRKGLAAAITVSPNVWNAECYYQAEQEARNQSLGIWKDDTLGPVESIRLPRNSNGFHIVTGEVVRIGKSNRATWINLDGDVALRIDHSDRKYFPLLDFQDLLGKRIEARGWIYTHKQQLRIHISHPRSMTVIND